MLPQLTVPSSAFPAPWALAPQAQAPTPSSSCQRSALCTTPPHPAPAHLAAGCRCCLPAPLRLLQLLSHLPGHTHPPPSLTFMARSLQPHACCVPQASSSTSPRLSLPRLQQTATPAFCPLACCQPVHFPRSANSAHNQQQREVLLLRHCCCWQPAPGAPQGTPPPPHPPPAPGAPPTPPRHPPARPPPPAPAQPPEG